MRFKLDSYQLQMTELIKIKKFESFVELTIKWRQVNNPDDNENSNDEIMKKLFLLKENKEDEYDVALE